MTVTTTSTTTMMTMMMTKQQSKSCRLISLLSILAILIFVQLVACDAVAAAFTPRSLSSSLRSRSRSVSLYMSSPSSSSSSSKDRNPIHTSKDSSSPLSTTGFLSHVMLKVPNVDETVKFWTSRGGTVRISRPITTDPPDNEHDEEVDKAPPLLKSAFVEMGCSSTSSSGSTSMSPPPTFALELVRTDANKGSSSKSDNSIRKEEPRYRLGNEIRYIGISKLLLFQNNLLGVITGDATKKEKGGMGGSDSGGDGEVKEPNGIDVQFSASAPGDFFARFCLRSNDLPATSTFYSTVLGMDIKAQDDQMLCLRYDNINFPSSTYGVATTLVFDASDKTTPIEKGDCLDHIAITTSSSVDELYNRITISAMTTQSSQQSRQVDETTTTTSGDSNNVTADDKDSNNDVKIFMKPTEMFGRRVMGLIDPNGYKVVVAGN